MGWKGRGFKLFFSFASSTFCPISQKLLPPKKSKREKRKEKKREKYKKKHHEHNAWKLRGKKWEGGGEVQKEEKQGGQKGYENAEGPRGTRGGVKTCTGSGQQEYGFGKGGRWRKWGMKIKKHAFTAIFRVSYILFFCLFLFVMISIQKRGRRKDRLPR